MHTWFHVLSNQKILKVTIHHVRSPKIPLEKCTAPLSDLAQELVKAQFLLRKKGRNSSGDGIRRQRRAALKRQ
jgi:hypothetical protein